MTARLALPALCLSVFLAGANAQEAKPTPAEQPKPAAGDEAKPPARETPPDQKAYTEASKITDPAKKIEALEKLKKDFPDSSFVAAIADSSILSTLAAKMPGETARIRLMAQSMYKAAEAKDKKDAADKRAALVKQAAESKDKKPAAKPQVVVTSNRRGSTSQTIATSLLNGNIMLKDAESYARKSLDAMKLPLYLSEQREAYTKRKQSVPDDKELTKRFKESRAARVATLGRIELKMGKTAVAKRLLAEAYGVNNDNIVVASALGEIAAQEGDNTKALEYLMTAKLSGRMPKTANAAFETAYKQQHNGSMAGLDAVLDAEYEKRFPNPVHPEVYKPSEKRTDRVVLAEVFTGSGCPPCVAADLAFDATMQRYARKDLAVVMYHQHVPAPDPMSNLDTQARAKSYGVSGVPTYVIDGNKTVGGGSRDNTARKFESIDKEIEKALDTASEAHIKVDASLAGNVVKVAAGIDGIKSDSKDLKVQILLVEKELRYTGENGVRFHPMVVRAIGGEKAGGYPIDANGKGTFEASFDLAAVAKALKTHLEEYEAKGHRGGEPFQFSEKKSDINRNDLAVVVFVQDDKTKHPLQSAYVDLATPAGTRPTNEAQ